MATDTPPQPTDGAAARQPADLPTGDKPSVPSDSRTESSTQPDSAEVGGRKGGREEKRNGKSRGPKRKHDVGRSAWSREATDKRGRNSEYQEFKRRKVDKDGNPEAVPSPFSAEEIAAEGRRPKRKVAVMVGYSGTGYKGMQINNEEKTIEGDLFKAFVAAGAISKANADDHKKSSLVRCARTDKGVHAAGNVISLKLIIEDEEIVDKINANLPDQIRVWGIQRTNNSFSCYQTCDSRWYEYLLPTYCLLPPHPDSWLWKQLVEVAKEKGYYEEFQKKLADVEGYWREVDEKDIKPILDKLDPETRSKVMERIHADEAATGGEAEEPKAAPDAETKTEEKPAEPVVAPATETTETTEPATEAKPAAEVPEGSVKPRNRDLTPLDFALRDIKAAYIAAKRRYRVTPERLSQLQAALNQYCGTINFHNYTVQKSFKDPSAKRHIKSFQVNTQPIQIRDTEWVSLKVHGQSFMMHQIRKMVGMAALVVRCATPLERIKQSYGPTRIAIPKAPGLGLLLERPVFDAYNRRAKDNFGKETIDFGKYDDKLQAFKDKQIYQRIFEVEEQENTFHIFFQQVDNFKSDYFLWLTAGGIDAGGIRTGKDEKGAKTLETEIGDEDEDPENGDG
ncbi:Putative pseudouridine synthase I, TruA, pseudouridine synthase TruA/RsuA/RluB/E/F [Colletotrichum destructivum]|uniref:tRNA pseudouridine synthase 1 n=1 Tax=Colletotrichum destructivum TaxID=34406 RepID=A0AAX4HZE2_9PEZI|nr:Putative pseudouridine synthase I, TruA, pseudouridine synthase TruA/RsuA/RluB/E/F [Colletotrichum destructivum]